MSTAQHTPGPSLLLQWRPVPASLPPDPEANWFSPEVWLALTDGRVVRGMCLHRVKNAQYDAPVHGWFEGNEALDDGVGVLAWMPFATPDFPVALLPLTARPAIEMAKGSALA
jgi:hypothetical protein